MRVRVRGKGRERKSEVEKMFVQEKKKCLVCTTKKMVKYMVEKKEYSDEGRVMSVSMLERQMDRKTDTQTDKQTDTQADI